MYMFIWSYGMASHSAAKSMCPPQPGVFNWWHWVAVATLGIDTWHRASVVGAAGLALQELLPPKSWWDLFPWSLFPLNGTTPQASENASVRTITFAWHSAVRSNAGNPTTLMPRSPTSSWTTWFWSPFLTSWRATTCSSLPLMLWSRRSMLSSSLPSCQGRRTIVTRKHGPLDDWLGSSNVLHTAIKHRRTVLLKNNFVTPTCWHYIWYIHVIMCVYGLFFGLDLGFMETCPSASLSPLRCQLGQDTSQKIKSTFPNPTTVLPPRKSARIPP